MIFETIWRRRRRLLRLRWRRGTITAARSRDLRPCSRITGHPRLGRVSETQQSTTIEHLSESECWKLLRTATTGRVAVLRDGAPDIFPVNHVVDHGTVVYRTHAALLFRATLHNDVAFEVDGFDSDTQQAWSVVVRGLATEGRQITDIMDALQLPLEPQQPGAKPRIVRIEPREVTGRRFTVVERADASTTRT